jgi:hypothetical protein
MKTKIEPLNPHKNPGVWCYNIINLPVQSIPYTHNAYAEIVDTAGNYRGFELGPFRSLALAEKMVKNQPKFN